MRLPHPERYFSALLAFALLVAWEVGSRAGFISPLFFPPPSLIVQTLFNLTTSGEIAGNALISLARLSLGVLLGGVAGVVLGLLMGWSRHLRTVIDPFVAATHPIPKIAILPLIMIIFGIGEPSLVVVIALGAFFPMLVNTMLGVRQINQIHFEVATNYGASPSTIFRRIVLPGSLPSMITGLRLALNVGLLITVAVEMVASRVGLGAMIWLSWEIMRTEELYASLAVIIFFGVVFNILLQYLARRLTPWQSESIA